MNSARHIPFWDALPAPVRATHENCARFPRVSLASGEFHSWLQSVALSGQVDAPPKVPQAQVIVPAYRSLDTGPLANILAGAGMTVDEFLELL